MRARFDFLDHDGPICFAHRGGAAEAPENSWTAFEHAVGLGYRYMETDVRATADGVALAFHDPGLSRVMHRPGLLARTSWAALRHVTLDDNRPLPQLEELLAAWPDLRWNIDVKTKSTLSPVTEAIRRAGAARRTLVTAFSGRRTALARRALGPELATGAGRVAIAVLLAAKKAPRLTALLKPLPAAAQVPMAHRGIHIVDEAFLRACHLSGIAVHIWTVDDAPSISRLLDMGVDGIMTDRPSVLKSVMVQRGQWA